MLVCGLYSNEATRPRFLSSITSFNGHIQSHLYQVLHHILRLIAIFLNSGLNIFPTAVFGKLINNFYILRMSCPFRHMLDFENSNILLLSLRKSHQHLAQRKHMAFRPFFHQVDLSPLPSLLMGCPASASSIKAGSILCPLRIIKSFARPCDPKISIFINSTQDHQF